jgi:hypothetical protein
VMSSAIAAIFEAKGTHAGEPLPCWGILLLGC